jgi:hypothetical protein
LLLRKTATEPRFAGQGIAAVTASWQTFVGSVVSVGEDNAMAQFQQKAGSSFCIALGRLATIAQLMLS